MDSILPKPPRRKTGSFYQNKGALGRQNHIYPPQIIIKKVTVRWHLHALTHLVLISNQPCKCYYFPVLWVGKLRHGEITSYLKGLQGGLNGSVGIRCSAQCLAHRKCSAIPVISDIFIIRPRLNFHLWPGLLSSRRHPPTPPWLSQLEL